MLFGIESKANCNPYEKHDIAFFSKVYSVDSGDGNQLKNYKYSAENDTGDSHDFKERGTIAISFGGDQRAGAGEEISD